MRQGADEWTVGTLRHLIDVILAERDHRYEQRFQEQQRALDKAETLLALRVEENQRLYNLAHANVVAHVDSLQQRVDSFTGENAGRNQKTVDSRASWMAAIALIAVVLQLVATYLHK